MTSFLQDPKVQEFLNWLVAFQHPEKIWQENRSLLACEFVFYITGFLTFIHAFRYSGRYIYLWWTALMTTVFIHVVLIQYMPPEFNNFWCAQSTVMLLGKQVPLYTICLTTSFLYTSNAAVARLRLGKLVQPFAVALTFVLLRMPLTVVGPKFLWVTTADTDPDLMDQHYGVPWFFTWFKAVLISSFALLFHVLRAPFADDSMPWKASNVFVELLTSLLTAVFTLPLALIQMLPIHHALHHYYGLHTEVCTLMVLALYGVVVWMADRQPSRQARNGRGGMDELLLVILLPYTLYMLVAYNEQPESVRSTGLHQTVGDCEATTSMNTILGQVVERKIYLCADNFNESYFNFHCVDEPPEDNTSWYTICGTPHANYMEFIIVVSAYCVLGAVVFGQMLFYSGEQPGTQGLGERKSRSKTKGD